MRLSFYLQIGVRVTAAILLCSCTYISLFAYAPEKQGDRKVTINGNNLALHDVFKAIRKQTGLYFMYNNNNTQINENERISLSFKEAKLDEVLAFIFEPKNLSWTYNASAIVLRPKTEEHQFTDKGDSSIFKTSVTGKVVDNEGKPIPGATILVSGENTGFITDNEGHFIIPSVRNDAILTISSVGFETRKVSITGKSIYAILNVAVNSLDETVVQAYSTTTRRFLTGNISSITSKDIEKNPVANPLLALQGRVPGIFVSQSTGVPGSGSTVRIQGQNSISSGNDPLYVVDGVPYTSQVLRSVNGSNILGSSGTGGVTGNPLNFINPNDIERIDVLKDADATSIYGSRAANGAILITTKKGVVGRTDVSVSVKNGWATVARKLPLLNRSQYLEMRKEAKNNDNAAIQPTDYDINGTWDTTRETNWQKELIGRTAKYSDAYLTISGGNSTTQFLIGAGYHKETTVFPGDFSDQKGSLHLSLSNISNNKRFQTQFTASYMLDKNNLPGTDLTNQAIIIPPNAPSLFNSDGSLNWAPDQNGNSTWRNPLIYNLTHYRNVTSNIISNATISYAISNYIRIKSSFGFTNLQTDELNKFPQISFAPELRNTNNRAALFSNGFIRSWIIEPQVELRPNLDYKSHHQLSILLGGTFQQKTNNQQQVGSFLQNNDAVLEDITAGALLYPLNALYTNYKYNALFVKTNYAYVNKYILSAAIRRDGSSRFGKQNLFHNFASISGAWIFTNEGFLKNRNHIISFGKLRLSYGTTGNDQIGDYQFIALYQPVSYPTPYQNISTLAPSNLTNPYLQWELTKKIQTGIDIGLFNDRILISSNYYRNRSSNQLQGYSLPAATGFTNITQNFPANVQNTGLEISIVATNIRLNKFSWKTTANGTFQKNKLLAYPGLATSSKANSLIIGEPITIAKLYQFIGVDNSTGLYTVRDIDGKPTSAPNSRKDRTAFVNLLPSFYGGIQNIIQFGNFDIDFLFQYVRQKAPDYSFGLDPGRFVSDMDLGVQRGNQPIYVLSRWQKVGDNSTVQRFSANYESSVLKAETAGLISTAIYQDASYVRLKNLSVSYTLSNRMLSKCKIKRAQVFLQTQNLITFSSYKGLDPETKSQFSLPPLRVITAGCQIVL